MKISVINIGRIECVAYFDFHKVLSAFGHRLTRIEIDYT